MPIPFKSNSSHIDKGVFDTDRLACVDFLQRYLAQPLPEPHIPFELVESHSAIVQLNPKWVCGPVRIEAVALQDATLAVMEYILDGEISHFSPPELFPTPVKSAKFIIIPKFGKDHMYPENPHPISLLPVIEGV